MSNHKIFITVTVILHHPLDFGSIVDYLSDFRLFHRIFPGYLFPKSVYYTICVDAVDFWQGRFFSQFLHGSRGILVSANQQ